MKKNIYLLLVLYLSLVSASFAQKGRFHVRFLVKAIDCNTGKAAINVQVKASAADSTFLMGDANYRFDYDPRIIRNPIILLQENFSSQSPASDHRYGIQNLNGSTFGPTKGTVSLNTTYGGSGTGAAPVGINWITVSTIQFDIVNTELIQNNCFPIVWHTDKPADFPITGMNEYITNANGYTLTNVTAGGVFGNLQVCIPEYCSINAVDDVTTTPHNTAVSGNVRTNDLTPPLVVTTTPIIAPRNGSIVLRADGSFTYTPQTGYSGKDSVQYQVCKESNPGVCDLAWLRITIGPPTLPTTIDLALTKTVSKAQPALQEVITYTLSLSNSGAANATGIEVKDLLPTGLQYQSSSGGTYNPNTGIWSVGTVNSGASVQLVVTAKVIAEGTWFNKAEVSKADQPDTDSSPNNDNLSEDDISVACIAIPVNICDGDIYQIGLPSGYAGIQWYKDGQVIQGATGSTLQVTAAGSYSFTATNVECPIQGCCPAIFVNGDCCKPTACVPITITKTKNGRL